MPVRYDSRTLPSCLHTYCAGAPRHVTLFPDVDDDADDSCDTDTYVDVSE